MTSTSVLLTPHSHCDWHTHTDRHGYTYRHTHRHTTTTTTNLMARVHATQLTFGPVPVHSCAGRLVSDGPAAPLCSRMSLAGCPNPLLISLCGDSSKYNLEITASYKPSVPLWTLTMPPKLLWVLSIASCLGFILLYFVFPAFLLFLSCSCLITSRNSPPSSRLLIRNIWITVILNFTEILVCLSHPVFGMIILDGLMHYLVYNWFPKQILFSNIVKFGASWFFEYRCCALI